MRTTSKASPNLCLAAQSYHTTGAQWLIIMWTAKRDHLQGIVSKVTLQVSQASTLRDNIQIRSGREQETLLGEGFCAELREMS